MSLVVEARAKINYSLGVVGVRPDGYHELDMLMGRISLCDRLSFEPADALELTVDGVAVGPDDDNLVLRAARALNDALGLRMGARMSLEKHIPSRAGLGGGSADCAAALVALDRLWGLQLSVEALAAIGLKLGADVPYCLREGFCRVRGIGEDVEELGQGPRLPLVLITPGGGLSTPAVFRAWNETARRQPLDNAALARALRSGELEQAQKLSANDLEEPALRLMPEIAEAMRALKAQGAAYVRMSGSGSTAFGLFQSKQQADQAASAIPGAYRARTV